MSHCYTIKIVEDAKSTCKKILLKLCKVSLHKNFSILQQLKVYACSMNELLD